MSTIWIGIDPGLSGAIAVIDANAGTLQFFDTPTVQVKSGRTVKNQMDPYAIITILRSFAEAHADVLVTLEKVGPMPGQGVTSMFNFGMGVGIWIGILAALKIPFQQVHPNTWKKLMMADMGKEKDASRIKAMQLFPQSAIELTRKKDHGRADALLLAAWAQRTRQGSVRVAA